MSKHPAPGISARTAPATHGGPAHGRPWRLGLCIAASLLLACGLARAAEAAPDVPVQEPVEDAPPVGMRIGRDLTLSGYATVQLLVPNGRGQPALAGGAGDGGDDAQYSRRTRLNVSHLSGIAWWEPSPAWKVLAEVDLQDVVQLPAHSGEADSDGADSAPYASLERLYADYRASDSVSLRVGKFLTPIGRWNQEHSDPQVWTVLRPLISQSAFPTNATGVMVFGSLPVGSQWIDYQTYASDGGDWRTSPHTHPFDRAVGARVATALNPDLQVGVSLSSFTQSDSGHTEFHLIGADGTWTWNRTEISAEAVARHGSDGNSAAEHGWFAQIVTPLARRWWAVARLEAYRRSVDPGENRTGLIGLVYRSGSHWVFKAEWAQASRGAQGLPCGLLSSLTLVY